MVIKVLASHEEYKALCSVVSEIISYMTIFVSFERLCIYI